MSGGVRGQTKGEETSGRTHTEFDKELSVTLALMLRHGEDAGDIVILRALLLLAEVTHKVVPVAVRLRHHIEQEGVRIVVQSLVVKEHLGHQAQPLAIRLLVVVFVFACVCR